MTNNKKTAQLIFWFLAAIVSIILMLTQGFYAGDTNVNNERNDSDVSSMLDASSQSISD